MGTSAVSWHQIEKGFMTSLPDKLKPKLLSVVHSELLDHPHFTEKIEYRDGSVTYAGITPSIVDLLQDQVPRPVPLLPVGVNIEHFHKTREIRTIQTVGQVGNGSANVDIKRPHW